MSGVIRKMHVFKLSSYISKQLEYSPSGSSTSALIGLILLSACAPVSPTAEQDQRLFERLCNAPDRDFIRREVIATGFAHARTYDTGLSCPRASFLLEAFTEMGYQYYECVEGPWLDGRNPQITTYRFSLEPKGASSCQGENDRLTKANNVLETWRGEYYGLENICIGLTKQKLPRSRYLLLEEHGRVTPSGEHVPGHVDEWRTIPGYISYSRARVFDQQKNENIAERKFYFYYPASAQYIDLRHDQCKVTGTWRISNVIKRPPSNN